MKHVLTERQVQQIAGVMLRDIICRHCHNRPRNVDRIRKEFNRLTLDWITLTKTRGKSQAEKTRREIAIERAARHAATAVLLRAVAAQS